MASLAARGELQQRLRDSPSMDTKILQQLLIVLENSKLWVSTDDAQTSEEETQRHLCISAGAQRDATSPPIKLSSSVSEASVISEYSEADILGSDAKWAQTSHAEHRHCAERRSSEGEHRTVSLSLEADQEIIDSQVKQVWGQTSHAVRQLSIQCFGTQGCCVSWPVASQRLQSSDKQIISPAFEVFEAIFKLMLKPKELGSGKGKSGFRKARGRGYVELKCEVGSAVRLPEMQFSLAIDGTCRGPFTHDFTHVPVACLPRECDEWNFADYVDTSMSPHIFTIILHIAPGK